MTEFGYPFAAVVGQERVKKALLLNLIDPRIGGVLLCGEKGTAKSTVVRGLAALTRQRVVELPLQQMIQKQLRLSLKQYARWPR